MGWLNGRPFKLALAGALFVASLSALTSCGSNVTPAGLEPTLGFQLVDGGRVAFQSGEPVPSYTHQGRPRLDLGSGWKFQPAALSQVLSFEPRKQSLKNLELEAAGRQTLEYEDANWAPATVPGSTSVPPDGRPVDGWYRVSFRPPTDWATETVRLKFASVNYLADVWLNGTYLGYHEGGVTPFAFKVDKALLPGARNVLAVRVYDPPKGARFDVVPWFYSDWWEYQGITGAVWLEASDPLHVVRADVVPHLDAADISVTLQNSSEQAIDNVSLNVEILPAAVTSSNLMNPDPVSLVPPSAASIATTSIEGMTINSNAVIAREASFLFSGADVWSLKSPALYVVGIYVSVNGIVVDTFYDTFGLRRIQVDPMSPRLMLDGQPIAFTGAAVQYEQVSPAVNGEPHGGVPPSPADELKLVRHAQGVNVDLLRTNHVPAQPELLMLTDRLGLAVWEEIPLNHYTPATFTAVMQRGLPQQMLAEMALRDFNRPSVMFHGFANESTGIAERTSAMQILHNLDRRIDGTRLTGQAMYGSDPTDPTSSPLDVAGYTFYYGIFYGGTRPEPGTSNALRLAHETYPHKPVMVLEFGEWVAPTGGERQQANLFRDTYPSLHANFDTQPDGFVGSAVWWSLEDYWTDIAGIGVERFGFYTPSGLMRESGVVAKTAFGAETVPGAPAGRPSGGAGTAAPVPEPSHFVLHLSFALLLPCLVLGILVGLMLGLRRWRLGMRPRRAS